MMPDTKIYGGIYLVVSVQQHVENGRWILIWGSGGFWTIFIRDNIDNILEPIIENDLLEVEKLRPSPQPNAADFGIARFGNYCVLGDPDEIWL